MDKEASPVVISPPCYSPPQGQIIIQQQTINYGPESQRLVCQHCHAQISTRTEAKATTKTHLACLVLCLCICWPCACLPYCMDSCQNMDHYCPNCNAYLGTYER